jgi:hypothetical protein
LSKFTSKVGDILRLARHICATMVAGFVLAEILPAKQKGRTAR